MSENGTTRRRFLEVAGAAAAAALLAPDALAAPRATPVLGPGAVPVKSPLPVGPGATFASYQSETYIVGMGTGITPPFTTNLAALEATAAGRLSAAANAQLLASAGGAAAARANAAAFEAWRIVPRMFVDRLERDLSTPLIGQKMPAPIILGPVGKQASAHPDGERAAAQGAAALGLTYVHSAQASNPPAAIAAAAPTSVRWFAIDWPIRGAADLAPLAGAKLAGCTHLIVSAPPPGSSWAPLDAVRRAWDGPVVLGGIQSVADARTAVARGVDAVLVSNERGRRGGRPVGTLDVLPKVVAAIGGKVPVLFGSGVRTGSDVFKALALGADAVVVGRPYVYGLALGGEAGVRHMLRTLLAEFDITLGIAGSSKHVRDLDAGALLRT